MKVSGSYLFQAPAPKVWAALMDPVVMSRCLPGCDTLDQVGDDQYQAVLSVGIGPIRGRYQAKIAIHDKIPPQSYRLVLEGTGPAGFAKGEALVTLVASPPNPLSISDGEGAGGEATTVQVEGDAQAGGPVARVGQRMMGSAAKMVLDQFFSCLQKAVSNEAIS
jgi:hypothetical protein